MVNSRRKLLDYLKRKNVERYSSLTSVSACVDRLTLKINYWNSALEIGTSAGFDL